MKMRKILSLLFALMLVTVFVSNSAMAAGTSMATATSISVNKTYSADTKAGTYYYRFTLPSSGTVTISVPTLNSQVLSIYNTSNVKLYTKTLKSSSPSATLSTAAKTTLSAGTYTLSYNHSSAGKIKSTIKLGYVSSNESFPDSSSDNSYSTANSISLNKTYYGFMPINDHTDYYKFKVGKTSSVKLQFSTTLKKYRLYIYNSSKQLQYDSGLLTATSKSATKTLKPGTYYFKVKAQKITTSYATGKYSFKLNVAGTIPSETELTATPGFNQIKLTWKQVPTASGYMIYRSSGTGYNLIKKTTSPETLSVRDLTAIPGVKYSYKVRAYNSVGVGPSSNVVAGISKLATPAINVTNQNIGRNRITVTKIKYADGYELYRALRPDGEFKLIGTMIELSVDHTQLKPGQTYYYKVRAFRRTAKGNIYSKFSEVKSCTAW